MVKSTTLEEYVTSQSNFSRRQLLRLLQQKKVYVNELIVTDLKHPIDANNDSVKVDGTYIEYNFDYLYFKFYKPKGVLSTMNDPDGRDCIGNYINQLQRPVSPVGRLDRQSHGLMILTNDGEFSNLLMHPSFKVDKTYYVKLDKKLQKIDYLRLEKGLILEDGPICFSKVSLSRSNIELLVTLSEGRNRIVRRAFEHIGYTVKSLKRESVGIFSLDTMESGQIKQLSKKEINEFKKQYRSN